MPEAADLVDRTSPLPLWAQVLEHLRSRLAAHEFDARFPTDAELVEDYGVSRQTVREAVRRLSAEGLLERERGRGTFVRTKVLHQPVGTLPEIFGSIREHLGPVTSTVLRLASTTDPAIAARLGLRPSAELVVVERVRAVAEAPIAHDTAWLPATVALPLLGVDFTTAVLADEVRDRCACAPDDVEEQIFAVSPSAADAVLLALPEGVALLAVDTLSSRGGAPYECRRVSFRADRIHLTSRWRRADRAGPTLASHAR